MNKEIVNAFGDGGMATDAQWIYMPNDKYGFVAVIEVNEDTWTINDNGKVTTGDYATILKKCIEIVSNNK